MQQANIKADSVLVCRDCGKTFIFSYGGQEFVAEPKEPPKRCRACREKARQQGHGHRQGQRQAQRQDGQHPATCWSCQKSVLVPFKPAPGRPVYCRVCYTTQKRKSR